MSLRYPEVPQINEPGNRVGRDLCARFAELGCWIRPMGKVVYLTPPFVAGSDDIALLTGAIRRVIGAG